MKISHLHAHMLLACGQDHFKTVRRLLFHPYMLFFIVTLSVWLPQGFNIGPVNDGWYELGGGKSMLLRGALINFGRFPNGLALTLVDTGFQGWQGVMFVQTVLRGILIFEIVRRLFPNWTFLAIACGLIGLFNPADRVFFWPGAVGVTFAFILALACCLSALVHLQTRSWESLISLYFFQIISCLSYAAFWPLIMAFPFAIWLLERKGGFKEAIAYFLRTTAIMAVFIVFEIVMISAGRGREGLIVDPNLLRTLAGYRYEVKIFADSIASFFTYATLTYLLIALVPGIFAYMTAMEVPVAKDQEGNVTWRFFLAFAAGLLALAVIAYLPYAISLDRYDNRRQLLAAGILIYVIPVTLLFVMMRRYMEHHQLANGLLVLLTAAVVVTGLESREPYVSKYRNQERLLAAMAQVMPHPPRGALIVVELHRESQLALRQFDHRWPTLNQAVRFMYGDPTLSVGVIDPETAVRPFEFSRGEVTLNAVRHVDAGRHAPYDRLVVMDYSPLSGMHLFDRKQLQALAPKDVDLSGYAPEQLDQTRPPEGIVCTMLEVDMRPAYCRAR